MNANDAVLHDLQQFGLQRLDRLHANLSPPQLVEMALARREGMLANSGAFVVHTGSRTGRSPRDKFIVCHEDQPSATQIAWGPVNQPMATAVFDRLFGRVSAYLQGRDIFAVDISVGADPRYAQPMRVLTELAWHALVTRQLFRRPAVDPEAFQPAWHMMVVPRFLADPARDGTPAEAVVALDLDRRLILICGTAYAGEIKKAVFTAMNYVLPLENVLPMHCSANVGPRGDVALFFGLSGTGKTTLATDPARKLIGDDEHGWSDYGVFNIEGGCYAQCLHLVPEHDPQIWNAIRFGAVIENVVVEPESREADYDDETVTQNTRVAYPLDFASNVQFSGRAGPPTRLVFLAADVFGVLPPIALLTIAQAQYYFLSGYTATSAGTEIDVYEPQVTFSTCFSAPFLPLPPRVYATLLGDKLAQHRVHVFLVNTGWLGGGYGVGQRITRATTRALVGAALSGALDNAETLCEPIFGLRVPLHVDGVPGKLLHPRALWPDPDAYDRSARQLAQRLAANFAQFDTVPDKVRQAGPRI